MNPIWMTVIAACIYAAIDLILHRRDDATDGPILKPLLTRASIFAMSWGVLVYMNLRTQEAGLQHALVAGTVYLSISGLSYWFRRKATVHGRS